MRLPVRRSVEVTLFRQALSFGVVGLCATLAHISLAWLLIDLAACNPYSANLFGTCTAFVVSFLGNASFTFRTDRSFWVCARRYLCVSLFSLAATSAILGLVKLNGLPTYVYAVAVFIAVPPTTFLLAKLWALSATNRHADYASIRPRSEV
jgi:putative flippase GtrA